MNKLINFQTSGACIMKSKLSISYVEKMYMFDNEANYKNIQINDGYNSTSYQYFCPNIIFLEIDFQGNPSSIFSEELREELLSFAGIDKKSYPYKYIISAEDISRFLNVLEKLLQNKKQFFIERNNFNKFLDDLVKAGIINTELKAQYQEKITTKYTLSNMQADAYKTKNAQLALDISKKYDAKFSASERIYWLTRAHQFNSQHSFFTNIDNVTEYLSEINEVGLRKLIESDLDQEWIFSTLARLPSIKHVHLDANFLPRDLNSSLFNFLANSSTITKLDMSVNMHCDYSMNSSHAIELAKALQVNKSIKTLLIGEHTRISDEGFIAIINALIANPHSKLQSLNAFNCGITNVGANYLLENLDKIPNFLWISLRGNDQVSAQTVQSIQQILDIRVEAFRNRKATAVSLAETGLFGKKIAAYEIYPSSPRPDQEDSDSDEIPSVRYI